MTLRPQPRLETARERARHATTNYAYAGASQAELLSETTAGGPAYTYTYSRTDGTGVAEIDTETTNGTSTSRVLSDAVTGQALDLTNAAGATAAFLVDGIGNQVGALTDTGSNAFQVSYDPYGTATVSAGSTGSFWTQDPFGFKAGIRTSDTQNNLVKFGLRWYLSGVGSWTQQDTLDSPLDPANANRYAYAGDDPINANDPDGRLSDGAKTFIGGCLSGAVKSAAVGVALAETGVGFFVGLGAGCLAGGFTSLIAEKAHSEEIGRGWSWRTQPPSSWGRYWRNDMELLIGLGIPALLALGVLQGMRYRIVAHERAAGRKPPTTPLIFTGMAIAAVALIVAIIAGLQ